MDENFFEVDFHTYCKKCKYKDRKEIQDPCNECLDIGMRENTRVPECFEEK